MDRGLEVRYDGNVAVVTFDGLKPTKVSRAFGQKLDAADRDWAERPVAPSGHDQREWARWGDADGARRAKNRPFEALWAALDRARGRAMISELVDATDIL